MVKIFNSNINYKHEKNIKSTNKDRYMQHGTIKCILMNKGKTVLIAFTRRPTKAQTQFTSANYIEYL